MSRNSAALCLRATRPSVPSAGSRSFDGLRRGRPGGRRSGRCRWRTGHMLTWSLGWTSPRRPGWTIDLVDVGVGVGPRPGLEHVDRELVVVVPGRDGLGGGGDPLGPASVQQPQLGVDPGRLGLDPGQHPDHLDRHPLPGDGEVLDRPSRSRPATAAPSRSRSSLVVMVDAYRLWNPGSDVDLPLSLRGGRSGQPQPAATPAAPSTWTGTWPARTPRWWPSSGAWSSWPSATARSPSCAEEDPHRLPGTDELRRLHPAAPLGGRATWSWPGGWSIPGSGGSETFLAPQPPAPVPRLEHLGDEADEEVAAWLAEAYRVGEQRHLRP